MNQSTDTRPAGDMKGYLLVFAGAVCISFAAFFVKDASVNPSAVAFYRLLFGAAALFVVALFQRVRIRPHRETLWIMVLAGAFFCGDLLFWHESIVIVGPGIATILTNFQVIFLALYGALFLGEKLSLPQKLSVPLALAGLALLLGLHETGIPPMILKGAAFGLMSALFYSGYVLSLRQSQLFAVRLAPVANIAWVSLFACLFVGLYCVVTGHSLVIPDVRTGLTLAALGVFCQSIGWFLLSLGLPRLQPFTAGLIMLAQPGLAFIWDILFYGTATGFVNILGACLTTVAIGMGIYTNKDDSTKP